MGCLFAAKFARGGVQVTLVDHRPDRASRLQQAGITVDTPDGPLTAKPTVTTRMPLGSDVIFLLTKTHSIGALQFCPETPIVVLQNGLTAVDAVCGLVGSARVIAGVTSEASTYLEEGHVRYAGSGITSVGSWTSCDAAPAIEAMQKGGFNVELTDAPGQKIWEKASIGSGINPLTALLNVSNGRLLEMREPRQLMRDLVVEATKVAATEGYMFPYSLVEKAEEVCRETSSNISSMLQDIRANKKTEIDAISGEILRRAQLAALPTPRTRVIWQLIKGLEQS